MTRTINAYGIIPDVFGTARRLNSDIEGLGLDMTLVELVKTRASQINGCAYCVHMHGGDAVKKYGEKPKRLYLLPTWRESPAFDARERAALAYAEAMTHMNDHAAIVQASATLGEHFSEKEVVALTALLAMINFWNRIAVGFGTQHAPV